MTKKRRETYDMSRSRLLSYIIPLFSQLDLPLVNKGKEWKHYYGLEKANIPEGSLVCPIMIENARAWYLGWYRGIDKEGNHLIESIETHTICKFCNCGFYYIEASVFDDFPQFYYSDSQFYQHYLIKRKYDNVEDFFYVVGWTRFHDDGTFTVKIRKRYSDDWVERTYKSMRSLTAKQIKSHMEDLQNLPKKEEPEGKRVLIASV